MVKMEMWMGSHNGLDGRYKTVGRLFVNLELMGSFIVSA